MIWLYIIGTIAIFFLSIILHEAGHMLAAREAGLKTSFGWDKKGPYTTIKGMAKPETMLGIYRTGIMAGSIPIIGYMFLGNFVTFVLGSTLMMYYLIFGIGHDVKAMIKIRQTMKNHEKRH